MTIEELFKQISKDELIKVINGTSPFFTMQDFTAMAKFILSVAEKESLLKRSVEDLKFLNDTFVNVNQTLTTANEAKFKLLEFYRTENENLKAELVKRNDWDQNVVYGPLRNCRIFSSLDQIHIDDLNRQIDELEKRNKKQNEEIEILNTKNKSLVTSIKSLDAHYIAFKKRFENVRNSSDAYQERIQSLQDFQSPDGVIFPAIDGEAAYNLNKRIANLREEVKELKKINRDFTGFCQPSPSAPNCRCAVTPTKDIYERFIYEVKKHLPEYVKNATKEIRLTEVVIHDNCVTFKGEI